MEGLTGLLSLNWIFIYLFFQSKCEDSGATPGAESTGYSSRPTSEHESRVGGGGADSCPSTAPTSEGGGTGMGAPPRQSAASSTPNTSATTLQSSRHPNDQYVHIDLLSVHSFQHLVVTRSLCFVVLHYRL